MWVVHYLFSSLLVLYIKISLQSSCHICFPGLLTSSKYLLRGITISFTVFWSHFPKFLLLVSFLIHVFLVYLPASSHDFSLFVFSLTIHLGISLSRSNVHLKYLPWILYTSSNSIHLQISTPDIRTFLIKLSNTMIHPIQSLAFLIFFFLQFPILSLSPCWLFCILSSYNVLTKKTVL